LPYEPKLILGGGSNILFTADYPGLVIKNRIMGIEIVDEDEHTLIVQIGGGVVWHDLVLWAVQNDFGGLENLSFIPGTVGAAPIQNIGAYGVEFDSVFYKLVAVDLATGESKIFDKTACKFGYRNSIFKNELKGRYLIARVQIKLTKKEHHLALEYGDIRKVLESENIESPTIADISSAVIKIRSSKLPDPAQIGNAGSFFKNPLVNREIYAGLLAEYPDMPGYEVDSQIVKIPAAWLIEQAGWKGFRKDDAGVYPKHALVLVNYGSATAEEMHTIATSIVESIEEIFGVTLEPEVNII
jgi:UDP-N-acetylmuramate dehydrogenase